MIILYNPSKKRDYGFVNKYGKDVVVKAGKEVVVEEQDLINLSATSRTFSGGYLVVKNVEDLPEAVRHLFENKDDLFVIDVENITSKIKGKMGDFYSFMNEVEERNNQNEKREIFAIAQSLEDLNMKKARRIEKVTGFDFKLEEDLNEE